MYTHYRQCLILHSTFPLIFLIIYCIFPSHRFVFVCLFGLRFAALYMKKKDAEKCFSIINLKVISTGFKQLFFWTLLHIYLLKKGRMFLNDHRLPLKTGEYEQHTFLRWVGLGKTGWAVSFLVIGAHSAAAIHKKTFDLMKWNRMKKWPLCVCAFTSALKQLIAVQYW